MDGSSKIASQEGPWLDFEINAMSASLSALAPDCIAILVQHLTGDDFVSLMKTGNRLLRYKLARNCSRLHFQSLHTSKFPFAALKLPELRCLSIYGTENTSTYLDFRNREELALIEGSKTIEKLDLRFRNSPALFVTPRRHVPRQSVRNRFPMLTTLIMHDAIYQDSLESLFGEFPETMTFFSLKYGDGNPTVNLLSVSKLPRHLQTLELRCCELRGPSKPDFELAMTLPPHLLHLCLETLGNVLILDHLPSTLKTLRFKAHQPNEAWQLSKLPPQLCSFWTNLSYWWLDVDAALPATLETFECSYFIDSNIPLFDRLPIGLKIVPESLFAKESRVDAESLIKRFPNLERATIYSETTVTYLTESLKTLICQAQNIRIDSALPSALTDLTVRRPIPSSNLKHIPSSLTSLTVFCDPYIRNQSGQDLSSQFPPWTEYDFTHIVDRIHLVSLEIDWMYIESGYSLAPLAKLETLKKFRLSEISLEGVIEAPKWLPLCLPMNLEHFRFASQNEGFHSAKRMPVKNFSPVFDLERHTPHLQALMIYCGYSLKWTLTPEFFASLPRGLLKLLIRFENPDLQLNAVSQVPRSLQSFAFTFAKKDPSIYLSEAHFKGLPPSLSSFILRPISSAHYYIDSELYNILPKSISVMNCFRQAEGSRVRRFLQSNLLTRGFQPPFFEWS